MTPINGKAYYEFADVMRGLTFQGALAIISLFDMTYFRSGWLLHLPNTTLEVAMGCSGIRYLVSYFVFGIAYAYLMKRTLAGRLITVAATIPISLFASIFRLTFIFFATYYISPKMAGYWPHVFISWSVFFALLLISMGLDQYVMRKGEKRLGSSKQF
jgi:exosortase